MFRLAPLTFLVFFATLFVPLTELAAQSSPADAATAFFNAIGARDWRRATRLVDPEAIAEARRVELSMLASWAERRPDLEGLKGEGMQGISFGGELDPRLLEKHRDFVVDLYGVRTLGELARLSPEELFVRSIEASADPSVRGEDPDFGPLTYRIVGTVQETDAVAHVLYRSTSPNISYDDPWHVTVLRAVRRGDRWLLRPDRELVVFTGTSILFQRMLDEQGPPE